MSNHWHEAAHTIVALGHGVKVKRVAIDRKTGGGVCTFVAGAASKQVLCDIYLAGPILESMMDPLYWDPNEVKDDWAKAGALLVGADAKATVARVKLRVRNLFPEIARVAAALLERGELDEGEILRVARMPPLAWTSG